MFGLLTGGAMTWIKIALVAVVVAAVAGFWLHYTSVLKERQALAVQVAQQTEALQNWQDQWDQMRQALAEADSLRREARKPYDQMVQLVERHDWDRMATGRPTLLARLINRGTAERFRVFECITDTDCPLEADPAPSD